MKTIVVLRKYVNKLTYYVVLGCGGVFNQPSAYFSSPGYPNNYPNNAHCTYNIEVPMDMQIVLTIHPYDLETNFDKLELRQMVSGSDNIVGILTGNENVERRFTSAENKFTLLFTSDGSVTRRGFRASYSVISSGILLWSIAFVRRAKCLVLYLLLLCYF